MLTSQVFLLVAVYLVVTFGFASAVPNILLLMADQHRHDVLSYAGNKAISTPNIDSLAKEGAFFSHAYSSTPTCTPARAALLTGQSPWNHGMLGYGKVALKYPVEMPRVFLDNGFATATIGKDHFGWNNTDNEGVSHGFQYLRIYDGLGDGIDNKRGEFDDYDAWFQTKYPGKNPLATGLDWNTWHGKPYIYPEDVHPTAWTGMNAISWLKQYDKKSPFFLKVSWHRPHSPYDPPDRIFEKMSTQNMAPIIEPDTWDSVYKHGKGCGGNDAWCGLFPVTDTDVSRRAYYGSVQFVDEWLGKVLQEVKNQGLWNNTFIIYTADHGDMLGDHYHWRKGFPYESSAHVPMIVRWPESMDEIVKLERGSTLAQVTELRDVLTTFVDVVGAKLPVGTKKRDGLPITCLLKDPKGCKWREYINLEHDIVYNITNHWNALTDGKIKYIFNAFFPAEQLFNLTADPMETHDLSGEQSHKDTLELWRQRMVNQFEQEGRGSDWVKDGKLQQRVKGQLYSPNYPQ